MSGSFTAVDLSQLPAPAVVEALSFETILAQMISDLQARDPAFTALLESDPAFKVLEVCAYRELLLRQRVNEAAKAVMLTYAEGSDLDQLAANFQVQRLVVTPANPDAIPPTPAVYEADNELRRRVQLSFEAFTTAGSKGSYVFAALAADGQVRDASAISPAPGDVSVYVLSREGNGTADERLLQAVNAAVSAESVRPMTDRVTVLSAAVTEYRITATLTPYPGPDANVIREAALASAQDYANAMHRMGYDVTISGLYSALHQPGVQKVELVEPVAGITMTDGEAAYCTAINLTLAGQANV